MQFRCTYCGCATRYREDLFQAEEDWNEGATFPPSCRKCVHGDGSFTPCGRQKKETFIAVMCDQYEEKIEEESGGLPRPAASQ